MLPAIFGTYHHLANMTVNVTFNKICEINRPDGLPPRLIPEIINKDEEVVLSKLKGSSIPDALSGEGHYKTGIRAIDYKSGTTETNYSMVYGMLKEQINKNYKNIKNMDAQTVIHLSEEGGGKTFKKIDNNLVEVENEDTLTIKGQINQEEK
jgi:hypothetical protein